jgi:AGZA family xanthine/uracil permease-like MFS transporter
MSQPNSSAASSASMLERFFKFRQHNTNVRTEIIAGFTTFLTMVYIVFVNPNILGDAGMDKSAVFVTTCIISAVGCIFMGLFTNLPVALAPAMGLNAYFAYSVVGLKFGDLSVSWQIGMGAIFWGAIGLLLLTLFRVRYWMIANIPLSLRIGITSGIGLFIGMMGLKNIGIIVDHPATLVTVGSLTSSSVLLGALGFFIIVVLAARNIHAAVLISIVITTLLGLVVGDTHWVDKFYSLPPNVSSVVGQVDVFGALDMALAGVIFSFMLVNLFDSSGTLIGVTDKAGLADEKGRFPNMNRAMWVDSLTSSTGALIGTSSVTAYIESSAGVSVGGRTGLAAIVVGLLFLLTMFFSPLVTIVPTYSVAGALIYVGVLMTGSLARVQWDDLTEATPAFITAVMMPFTFSITEGIAIGFITYCVVKLFTGRWRDINLCVVAVALLFLAKIIFTGS